MKRTLAFLLALLTVVLCGAAAFAEAEQQPEATADPMGVQQVDISDGSATVKKPEETASPDDLQLELEAPIDGYASFRPTSFELADRLGYYKRDETKVETNMWYWSLDNFKNSNDEFSFGYYQSGLDADYALLRMDVTNLAKETRDFLEFCSVKVIYDNTYEYTGWVYQSDYDNETHAEITEGDEATYLRFLEDADKQNMRWAIAQENQFAIDPMFQGHYIFGCTLPNTVVQSKAPLAMIISFGEEGEYQVTYNIRK